MSEYNFFKDIKKQIPADNVIPYKIANPLFSDYSYKFRFVHIPKDKAAEYSYGSVFKFPIGTTINSLRFPEFLTDSLLGSLTNP